MYIQFQRNWIVSVINYEKHKESECHICSFVEVIQTLGMPEMAGVETSLFSLKPGPEQIKFRSLGLGVQLCMEC